MNRLASPFILMAGILLQLGVAGAQAADKPLDRVLAVVDDDVILQSELDTRLNAVASRLQAQGTALPPRDVMATKVLEQLVLDSIQLQHAQTNGMRISDNELNETMANIAKHNGFTAEQFERALASEGLSYREAREQIRQEMLVTRIQQRSVQPRVRVTDREVDNFLSSAQGRSTSNAEYLIGHILIAVDDFNQADRVASARTKAEEVLAKLKAGEDFRQLAVAYSDAGNALQGGELGWRRENQLPSLIADIAPSLKVNGHSTILKSSSGFHLVTLLDKRGGAEKIVRQTQARHILVRINDARTDQEAHTLALSYYAKIGAGESFAALAKAHSDDPVSGSAGGDLGWVTPGEMVPEFEKAMDATAKGQVSVPFRSRFGWHILQVLDYRQEDIGPKVQLAQARQTLTERRYELELQTWLREIRAEAFVEIKDEKRKPKDTQQDAAS